MAGQEWPAGAAGVRLDGQDIPLGLIPPTTTARIDSGLLCARPRRGSSTGQPLDVNGGEVLPLIRSTSTHWTAVAASTLDDRTARARCRCLPTRLLQATVSCGALAQAAGHLCNWKNASSVARHSARKCATSSMPALMHAPCTITAVRRRTPRSPR